MEDAQKWVSAACPGDFNAKVLQFTQILTVLHIFLVVGQ